MSEKGDPERGPKDPDATPFVIGVVGDFSGISPRTPFKDARFVEMDVGTFARWSSRIMAETSSTEQVGPDEQLRSRRATLAGLAFLLNATAVLRNVKVKVLDSVKQRLLKDVQRATEFYETQVFKKVYEQELGTLGGEPFGCLVFDYWIHQNPDDLELLQKLASVAGSAALPMLIGIGPGFFSVPKWQDLNPELSTAWMLSAAFNLRWTSTRSLEDMKSCFGFLPRLAPPVGIHPGFFIASLASQAFLDLELRAIARRLFNPCSDRVRGFPVQAYEWNSPESLSERLCDAGLNCLGPHTRLECILQDAVPMAKPEADGSVASLAEALLVCQLHMRLHSYVRRKRTSDSFACFRRSIDQWIEELTHPDEPDVPDLPFEFVSKENSSRGSRLNFRLRPNVEAGSATRAFVLSISMSYLLGADSEFLDAPREVTLRLALLTPGSCPKETEFRARSISIPEVLFRALGKPSIKLTVSGIEPGKCIDTRLQFDSPNSLDADQIINCIPRLRELNDNRYKLLNIAAYADVSMARKAAMAVLGWKPGAVRAIRLKVEAWKSAVAGGPDSPVTAKEVDASLPFSVVSDWDVDWNLETDFEVCESWAEPVRQAAECTGWARIHQAIDALENLIARYLMAIYSDPALHQLECTEESVRLLLRTLESIEVLPLDPESMDELIAALNSESPYRDRHCGFQSNLLMVEITQPSQSVTDAVRALLESDRLKRTLVLVGVSDQAGLHLLENLAHSQAAANLVVCMGHTRVARTRSIDDFSHSLALPELTVTGIYRAAEVLVRNKEEVFPYATPRLHAVLPHFEKVGWHVSRFGHALLVHVG